VNEQNPAGAILPGFVFWGYRLLEIGLIHSFDSFYWRESDKFNCRPF
jgi:hypothetical protein